MQNFLRTFQIFSKFTFYNFKTKKHLKIFDKKIELFFKIYSRKEAYKF